VLVCLPVIRSAALENLGLVSLLKAQACDPSWFVCKVLPSPYPLLEYEGNRLVIQTVQGWLEKAINLQPQSDTLRLHLAETAFAQGDRATATRYLNELKENNIGRSPLLQESRYEARLVKARQEAMQGDWEAAVRDYRLGLAWGDERTLPMDENDYFQALAGMEKQKITNNPQDLQAVFRTGRYLAQAGDWSQAAKWLGRAELIAGLDAHQAAMSLALLGRYREIGDDQSGAIDYYQRALLLDPNIRQVGIRLLNLLRLGGEVLAAGALEKQLLALGPTYNLGIQGDRYLVFKPAVLPNGWTLVGYDLDQEMQEQAKTLELVLWWQSDGKTPPGSGWTKVGEYWLQPQEMTNLAPNGGFEWGLDERGMPLGYKREIYNAHNGSVSLATAPRKQNDSSVLYLNNSISQNIGLITEAIPVDANSYYLMAGSIFGEGSNLNIGRNCFGQKFTPSGPFYIAYNNHRILNQWINYSDLSLPFPNESPDFCEILLANYQSSEGSYLDQIIFGRIAVP
jgi:tetratricopeptide (TPR) repeat protein